MAFAYLKKNPVVRLFSSFAHCELMLNPFCRHCSNKTLSALLKIPYVKIQIFRDISLTWLMNYFFAKSLEILSTGLLEIGKFV